jgi:hypothetical protein
MEQFGVHLVNNVYLETTLGEENQPKKMLEMLGHIVIIVSEQKRTGITIVVKSYRACQPS